MNPPPTPRRSPFHGWKSSLYEDFQPWKRVAALALALVATLTAAAALAPAASAFSFQPGAAGFSVAINGEGGVGAYTTAGGHPYSVTTTVDLATEPGSGGEPGGPRTEGDLRDLTLEEPAGLIENPSAVARCSQSSFHTPRSSPFEASRSGESCPALSQVGVIEIRSSAEGGSARSFGVFNLEPPPGFPAQIGANPFGVPLVLTPTVRGAGGEYGLDLRLGGLSQRLDLRGFTLTLWGTPWATSHNYQRGNCLNEAEPAFGWAKCPISPPRPEHTPYAYLTLPAACGAPLAFGAKATSWQGATATASAAAPALEGCAALRFQPVATARLTDPRASSPSGFEFSLTPKEEALTDPGRLVPSPVRTAVVSLPAGVTLNPSLAAGLGSCDPARYAAETATSPPGAGCPSDSKIGDFTVRSPLFSEPVAGAIYLAEPDDPATAAPGAENPFDSLLALYLVAKAPARGILVKVAGRLEADPLSGSLTAVFDRLPQLPYSDLELRFREGQRAPLVTPAACGPLATRIALSPWSGPGLSLAFPQRIDKGIGPGGACPAAGATPFAPAAVGGTLNSQAGAYSPFYLHLARSDAEAEVTSYSATLPPGLLGGIAGIPYCPDAAIAAAAGRAGRAEEARPSCPAASQIGHTVSGYGVGAVLAYAPGRLYLAGPYHGSPFSVVAIDSARVGPFDLGTIVVRSAIRVDPATAQVSIDSAGSDPIPHILDGIPIHLRDIRVYIDRPQLMVNPTSCEPAALSSTLTGSAPPFADPDQVAASVAVHFQAAGCGALGFEPRFGLRLRGGRRRGSYPALRAAYRPHAGDANTAAATVTLPPSLFLAQEHIRGVCSRVHFARGACPADSVYGRAVAVTPLLAAPLAGPVYLRSSTGPLPDLVVALRGDGLSIDLVGTVSSSHGGLRVSFAGLPDAPVSAFTLNMRGGKRGLLVVDAEDLCASTRRAAARFVGHASRGERLRPRLRARCHGTRHRRRHGHRRGNGRGHRPPHGGKQRPPSSCSLCRNSGHKEQLAEVLR